MGGSKLVALYKSKSASIKKKKHTCWLNTSGCPLYKSTNKQQKAGMVVQNYLPNRAPSLAQNPILLNRASHTQLYRYVAHLLKGRLALAETVCMSMRMKKQCLKLSAGPPILHYCIPTSHRAPCLIRNIPVAQLLDKSPVAWTLIERVAPKGATTTKR